jgi:hypothetical protein
MAFSPYASSRLMAAAAVVTALDKRKLGLLVLELPRADGHLDAADAPSQLLPLKDLRIWSNQFPGKSPGRS